MIVDRSALVAILLGQPEEVAFATIPDAADSLCIPAAACLELSIMIEKRRISALSNQIDEILERYDIYIEFLTSEEARIARQAYRDDGKGSASGTNLNFGNCFSYALAGVKREPLLYKGDDFLRADVHPAI